MNKHLSNNIYHIYYPQRIWAFLFHKFSNFTFLILPPPPLRCRHQPFPPNVDGFASDAPGVCMSGLWSRRKLSRGAGGGGGKTKEISMKNTGVDINHEPNNLRLPNKKKTKTSNVKRRKFRWIGEGGGSKIGKFMKQKSPNQLCRGVVKMMAIWNEQNPQDLSFGNTCLWTSLEYLGLHFGSKKETKFLDKSSKTIDILPVFFKPKWSLKTSPTPRTFKTKSMKPIWLFGILRVRRSIKADGMFPESLSWSPCKGGGVNWKIYEK